MNQAVASPLRAHPAFDALREARIDSLNLTVEHYEHKATGAVHYHLASDSPENVFLVALRTVPHDSTGVAHILEHTALCGSERFPVRDPFFMMLRRSLNTFMNAFTSSDWTAYPFASQNRKDFDNLLNVYMDAVFFSRLDPLDFAQEGHRVEFAERDNPDSDLVFKGVVFNEMKGAMSSVSSTLWQVLCEHLFPTSTYHYNSGGDPAHIPDLSYDELSDFYRSHYHPSNAIFMTFGDIPATEHQARFEELALAKFERLEEKIAVAPEQRIASPLQIADSYAFDEPGSTAQKTHIVMGWLLGESSDLQALLEAQLLSSVLMETSASPLQRLLETTELGLAPSPLCGLEDSMREMVFCCGIEGSESEHRDAFETQVLQVIEDLARDGVAQERVEAVLHQLELHQREISGDSYPYGLQLILQSLGCATHYSDPIAVLNLDPVIAELREQIKEPDFIPRLARKLLLENPHRVTLVMSPDQSLSQQRDESERARLADIASQMDSDEKARVIELAHQLEQRQAQVDDESILPKVTLADVPATLPELTCEQTERNGVTLTRYAQGTNGLVYQQAIAALPQLSADQQALMPYYTNLMTELGLNGGSYLETQNRQSATVGSINTFTSMRGDVNSEQAVTANLVLSSKALAANSGEQIALMRDTLYSVTFEETDRIRDMISQQRARREQSVTGNGHGLAMAAACAGMSPLAQLNHQLTGLAGIRSVRKLDEDLRSADALAALSQQFTDLHKRVADMPVQLLAIAEAEHMDTVTESALAGWPGSSVDGSADLWTPTAIREARNELWVTNTQVNFCARAYPTVPVGHPDAAPLTVLGAILRNGFLHRAIREQGGAYGGGASQDSGIAAFRFYSYRDPRFWDTLADFDASIAWIAETNLDSQPLEEAILGVVGSLDKPSSPAGEAKQHFHNGLFGRSHAQRERFRQQILSVTLDDVRRVASEYLTPENASTAVITNPKQRDADLSRIEDSGLLVQEL